MIMDSYGEDTRIISCHYCMRAKEHILFCFLSSWVLFLCYLFNLSKQTVTSNFVFSSKLYNYYTDKYSWVNSTKTIEIYITIFTFIPNNTFQLSTTPVNLTICNLNNSNILNTYDAYPGETVNFSIAAINAVGNYSYSIVSVAVVRNINTGFTSDINWHLCISYKRDWWLYSHITTHTNDNSSLDTSKYSGLLFTVPSIANITVVDIILKSCPPGFKLNSKSGLCICSHLSTSLNFDGYTPMQQMFYC